MSDPSTITMFDPHSPQAQDGLSLFNVAAVILFIILAIVVGMLIYIVGKYRAGAGETGEPRQVHGNTPFEIGWTVAPLIIVTVLTILMARTMLSTHKDPVAAVQPDVIVTGHQWWWEVYYPRTGVITANEIHVPVGQRSYVQLKAYDVIHDFWVPQLGPKQDMLPGGDSYVYLEPQQAGLYRGTCAEFCGTEHAWMRILVVAESPQQFQSWQSHEAVAFARPRATESPSALPSSPAPAPDEPSASASPQDTEATPEASASIVPGTSSQATPTPVVPDAAHGAQVFREMTCVNCHRGPDMTSGPNIGPDLSWVGDRKTLAAGAIEENSPAALAQWLQSPERFKSECNMPDFHLTQDQVTALVAYLWRKSQ